MTLTPGSRLGPFQIVSCLGAGGMGEVYRARDTKLNRDVAIKVLLASVASDPDRLARFSREAQVLASLNHPNIAHIHGLTEANGVTALILELVEGEDLAQRIARGAMPIDEALAIARQIAEALEAAHEQGIIHRDLKPANIKLRADGIVKVLDFGLAKALDPTAVSAMSSPTLTSPAMLTGVGVVLGTAAYMSPEQARGLPLDRRTDIWAFGCVVYEMLAGHRVFAGPTSSDTIAAVLTGEIDWSALPVTVPSTIRQMLRRCLERSVKARLRDIGDALFYLDETASSGRDLQTPAVPLARTGVSRRALLTSSAALGLLGASMGATFADRRREPEPVPSYQRLTFRRGMIRTARFAPDFRTVLYGALWDGDVCRVFTVRPESPESSAVALAPATPLAVASTGELALALGTHRRGIMTYGTLARAPMAGGAPRELQERVKYADWTADGRELAIVRGLRDRDVLEFPAGNVIAEPAAPGGFSFVRISPRGDALAVFELDSAAGLSGKVVIFDRSGTRQAVSAPYFNVFGLAWHGEEVWFTAADELPLLRNAVQAMNASGAVRIVARVPGNTTVHDISPDGGVLIARTEDRGGITVRPPGAPERDLSWLDAATLADLSPDGNRALFYEGGVGGGSKGSVYLRGTDGSAAVRLGDGTALALSPDGRWAIARTSAPYLDLMPVGAGTSRRLERPGLTLVGARWLRDGRRLVVRGHGGGAARLYVIDVDGTSAIPVTPEGLSVAAAGWMPSPDGSMVAVSTPQGPELFPIAGGAPRRVPGAIGQSQVVGWIISGLLVSDDPLGGGQVDLLDPSTGRRSAWIDLQPQDPAGIMTLDLSMFVTTPDGRGYGYTWHRATSDLFLVRGWS